MADCLCHLHSFCHFSSTCLVIVHTKVDRATKSELWSYPSWSQTISFHYQKVKINNSDFGAKLLLIWDQVVESQALKLMIAVEDTLVESKCRQAVHIFDSSFHIWKETLWCQCHFLHSYQWQAFRPVAFPMNLIGLLFFSGSSICRITI